MALCLGVQPVVLESQKWDNPGKPEDACREVLSRWLQHAPGTGATERTWHAILEALETSGHRQVAEELKREQFGEISEGPVSGLTSPFSQPVLSVGESCPSLVEPLGLISSPSYFLSPI